MEELDKAVEFGKLVSLQPMQFLDDIPLVSGSSFSLTHFLSNCTRATIYS